MTELATNNYKTLSFDCYGTLIDWERGILDYLMPLLKAHDAHVLDTWLLNFFSECEPDIQQEGGNYKSILSRILETLGRRLAFTPSDESKQGFAASIGHWPAFPDTVDALNALAAKFDLAILSNIDGDLFALSSVHLQAQFKQVITAEQVGFYKPAPEMFDRLIELADGPILHVAQSRYHDINAAHAKGLDTVWINRPSLGAAKNVEANPTWTFTSMADFSSAILGRPS